MSKLRTLAFVGMVGVSSMLLLGCPAQPRLQVSVDSLHFEPYDPDIPSTYEQAFTIKNNCQRDTELTFTITSDKTWVTVDPAGGTLGACQKQTITVTIESATDKSAFNTATLSITSDGGDAEVGITTAPNYFTQSFDAGEFDLENSLMKFIPTNSRNYYRAEIKPGDSFAFPVEIPEGTPALPSFLAMDPIPITPLGGEQISFYGQLYDTVYVGSNGRITFEDPAGEANPQPSPKAVSAADHFAVPGISGLYTQLGLGGNVTAVQLEDRLVITYDDVPFLNADPGDETNSFQIELFFDSATKQAPGMLRLTWLNIGTPPAGMPLIVGLSGISAGALPPDLDEDENGIPDSFQTAPSDLTQDADPTTTTKGVNTSLDF